jgi:thioredoxin 1
MPVQNVTEATFEKEVLRSELPVLIDFHADWCAPCKQQSPIVEQIAKELEGKLKVVKVDVDRSPRVAASFRVQSVPTLALVHEGQIAGYHPGLQNKQQILEMVQQVLPRAASEVKPAELAQLLTAGRAVPVDIRDAAAFGRTRIPRAVNVPADELEKRRSELSARDGRVRVLYARSTDEARTAAEKLRSGGIEVGFLDGGFLHWEADGLPVERPG